MVNHVYKKIEITGTSEKSIEDAIDNAIERASKTVKQLRWFEVVETRGDIQENHVAHWQVTVKIGFTLEDE
jgi:flavin-binding protein dodecin